MNKKSLSVNTVFYLIYNVLNVLFPFLTGVYVARVLLAENIGEMSYAQNIVQYFIVFAFLGIPTYGLREIAKRRDDKEGSNKLFTELFLINLFSTIVFSALYFVLVFSISRFRNNIFIYCIFGLNLVLNSLNITWLFEGREDFKYISIRNLVFKTVSFLLLIILVRRKEDYLFYGIVSVIGTAGSYILDVIIAKKSIRFQIKGINIKKHLKPVFFLVVVNLAIEIYTMVDITMLGIFKSNEIVAYYSYGNKIFKILLQIVNTFTIVVVPRLSLLKNKKNDNEYNSLLSKTFILLIMISLPAIVGIFFTSDQIIPFIYGQKYCASSPVLKILSINLLISPIGYLLGSRVMLINGKERYMILPVAFGALVNIVGNLLLISAFDEKGAAIASVISEIAVCIFYLSISHRFFKLSEVFKSTIKISLSCFTMVLLLVFLKDRINNVLVLTIIQVFGAITIYFLVLFVSREKEFLSITKKMANRLFKKQVKMKKLFTKILIIFCNLFSFLGGLIVGRSKHSVIVGSWGGQKYADNSRYLFCFLSAHKKEYNLKHVVWATRNIDVYNDLSSKKQEVCLIGTKKSLFYHLKCGVHIICNMSFSFGKFLPDIDTRFSCGALKIQLWHGVGIKRIGLSSNEATNCKSNAIDKFLRLSIIRLAFSQGCWFNQYTLCTSKLNAESIIQSLDCNKKRLFLSSYARFCSIDDCTNEEQKIVNLIKNYNGVFLYLPTFRKDYSRYTHPLDYSEINNFLLKENILFIEKPHSASNRSFEYKNSNFLSLQPNFDINTIINHCTCVISDYSSVLFDGIHLHKPVVFFVPDLDFFALNDTGLFMDLEKTFDGMVAKDLDSLLIVLKKIVSNGFFSKNICEIYSNTDGLFFNGQQKSLQEIWGDILSHKRFDL